MATLDIIVKPKLKFSLKKCGEVVPYGITPEERAKLAGIEENANNYTHPETHPSSILDVVDVVNGAAKKFLNERGEMVPLKHESLTDKNSEADFQHIDTTVTKLTLVAADKVSIYDSETGKMVLTPKSNIDETFKKLAVRRGATFNTSTGFYELNGLTDITEEQMMDIYNYTSQLINSASLDETFALSPIRTSYKTTSRLYLGVNTRYSFSWSEIEVFKQNNLTTGNCISMFRSCLKLTVVDYISLGNPSASFYLQMFRECTALETCFLRNIKANLSLEWSPLLSLASLQYIIQYRGNGTTPITITVHPTVFAKLTDNVNYPTWYAVAQDALTKYITFATV